MPKVHTQVARADIYERGLQVPDAKTKTGKRLDRSQPANEKDKVLIPKGSTYYSWSFRYGGKHLSLTCPKPKQLTQSPYQQALYDIQDKIDALGNEPFSDAEDFISAVEDIKGDVENLKDETESSLQNIPEQLQESHMLNERLQAIESAYDEFDSIDLDYDAPDEDDIRGELADDITEDPDAEEDEEGDLPELTEQRKKELVPDSDVEEKVADALQEWINEKIEEIQEISLEG